MAATASSRAAVYPARARSAPVDRLHADRRLFERFGNDRDPVDRDVMVERFLPLARQLAVRYTRPGEPFDDVFQVACLALLKAVDRFDPVAASHSQATPCRQWLARSSATSATTPARCARHATRSSRRASRASPSLGVRSRPPAIRRGRRERARLRAGGRPRRDGGVGVVPPVSLDAPRVAEDDAEALVADLGAADEGFARTEDRAMLGGLMRSLTPREREAVRLRFQEDLTQAAIGERIGISQMQVSRLLRQALDRLRREADAEPYLLTTRDG